jgi:hypothetical protein
MQRECEAVERVERSNPPVKRLGISRFEGRIGMLSLEVMEH